MLYKSDTNGLLDVEINGEPFFAKDATAPLQFSYDASNDWKWSLYNSEDSPIEISRATNILLTPLAQSGVMIDKFLLTGKLTVGEETPKLTRKLLTFDLSEIAGVPAILDIVAETDVENKMYDVGMPVIESYGWVYVKSLTIFFNGKSTGTVFDIDEIVQPGVPTLLDEAMGPIPAKTISDNDEISLSFEEIYSLDQAVENSKPEPPAE